MFSTTIVVGGLGFIVLPDALAAELRKLEVAFEAAVAEAANRKSLLTIGSNATNARPFMTEADLPLAAVREAERRHREHKHRHRRHSRHRRHRHRRRDSGSDSGSGSGSGGDSGSDSDGGRRHRHRRRRRHRRKSRGRGHDSEGARPVSVRVDMHGATPAGSDAAAVSGDDVDGVHAHTPPLPDVDQHPSQARAPSPHAVSASGGGSAPASQASMMALPSAASAVRGRWLAIGCSGMGV